MNSTTNASRDRSLRFFTFLACAIALPLDIVATVLSLRFQERKWVPRHVTAFCFIFFPLAMTTIASFMSLRYMKKHSESPRGLKFLALDLVSALTYLGVLIPCWTVEINEFNAGGFGLLVGYTTAPLIINMLIHFYFALSVFPFKKFFSKLYSSIREPSSSCQECPNCQAKFPSRTPETTTKKGYSLLRGEDYLDVEADPIQYRDSEDFLGEGAERAEQAEQSKQTEQPEDGSKGKDMMEV